MATTIPKKPTSKKSKPSNGKPGNGKASGELLAQLREHFGFDNFKDNQDTIIQTLLAGRDTFVIMPTGGGKSLCYQLPAIISEGVAIIVSPLIALMKNQVDLVRSYSSKDNVAHFLNSTLNKKQIREVHDDLLGGHTKMLYVAPETLTKQENLEFFSDLKISFFAVDEAHCISEWGHDFRPEYLRIPEAVAPLGPPRQLALTATAAPPVQADITRALRMERPAVVVTGFDRPNLSLAVRATRQHLPEAQAVDDRVVEVVIAHESPALVYALTHERCEEPRRPPAPGSVHCRGLPCRVAHRATREGAGPVPRRRTRCRGSHERLWDGNRQG